MNIELIKNLVTAPGAAVNDTIPTGGFDIIHVSIGLGGAANSPIILIVETGFAVWRPNPPVSGIQCHIAFGFELDAMVTPATINSATPHLVNFPIVPLAINISLPALPTSFLNYFVYGAKYECNH